MVSNNTSTCQDCGGKLKYYDKVRRIVRTKGRVSKWVNVPRYQWFQVVLTIFSSVLASSGLWAYLQKKSEQKDVKTEMLIGLAHDRIMYLGMSYIDRGCVTQDEYENLRVYLYEPYERMGGNGSAKRIMQEVDKLPIHKFIEKEEEHNEHE